MTNYFERTASSKASYANYAQTADIKRAELKDILQLKTYDRESMMIQNRLHSEIGCVFSVLNPLTNAEEDWHIRLGKSKQPWGIKQSPSNQQFLCLESETAQYWVSDGLKFLAHLTGIHLKKSQSNMLNMLLPKIPAPVQAIFGWKLAYLSPPPADAYQLDLHYGSNDVDLKVKLAVDNTTCLKLIHHQQFNSMKQRPLPREITISTTVSLGHINAGMIECSQLQAGDLIFFNHSHFNPNGSGTLPLGPFTLYSQIELVDGQYHLAINRWERTMTNETMIADDDELISDDMEVSYQDDESGTQAAGNSEETTDAEMLPVGDIPLKIDVRLGSIKFAVKDLHKIVEGKLYPIHSPCKGQVQLMHNDMEIARGQLVEVDGKLAIEIQKHWVQA